MTDTKSFTAAKADFFPDFGKYTLPAMTCLPGSAWHDWSKCGAIWRKRHTNPTEADVLSATDIFACKGTFSGSTTYNSKRRAFMQGVKNYHKLKRRKDYEND